jgi:hypothetical protein
MRPLNAPHVRKKCLTDRVRRPDGTCPDTPVGTHHRIPDSDIAHACTIAPFRVFNFNELAWGEGDGWIKLVARVKPCGDTCDCRFVHNWERIARAG